MNAKINKVVLNDFSEYVPGKCNNGGYYGVWTNYDRVKNGWRVSYDTTADFEFCPVCGLFSNHYDNEKEEYICGDFEVISTDELEETIQNFQKFVKKDPESYYINVKKDSN